MIQKKDIRVGQTYVNDAGVTFKIVGATKLAYDNVTLEIKSSSEKDNFHIKKSEFASWINHHNLHAYSKGAKTAINKNALSINEYKKKLKSLEFKQKEAYKKALNLKMYISDKYNLKNEIYLTKEGAHYAQPYYLFPETLKKHEKYEKLRKEFMKAASIYRNYYEMFDNVLKDFEMYHPAAAQAWIRKNL